MVPARFRMGWLIMTVAATGVAVYSAAPYLTLNADAGRIPINPRVSWHFASIASHGIPSALALILGPLQFSAAIRRRSLRLHRFIGRVYLLSVLIGAVIAVAAASASTSGLPAQVGFVLLATAWLYTGAMALLAARKGQIAIHRVWAIRNYALTFAAVLLRIFLVLLLQVTTFPDAYTTSVWASILVSYWFAEWFLLRLPRSFGTRTPSTARSQS